MPTPLKPDALKILLRRALCSGVRSLREELIKLENLDPKEPNYKAKLEMRLKIMRLLGELAGEIPVTKKGGGRPKKGVQESGEELPGAAEELASGEEPSEEELEEQKRRIEEGHKKLDRTGAK